jgi:glycosyltransferase involved in cell wall biosynthesis
VVIPTYNGAGLLAETIASVRAQTFTSWELVVYDDGSSDDTVAVARAAAGDDPRVTVVEGRNGGVAAARNAGFALTDTRSRHVAFLDHDDVWEPGMLAALVGELDEHEQLVAVQSTAICIDEHGRRPDDDDLESYMRHRSGFRDGVLVPIAPRQPASFAEFANANWIVTPGTLLVRRSTIDAIGGFDSAMTPADDWDMAVRVSRRGDVGFVDRPLLRWRRHAGAQSYASPDYGRAFLRVRHKMLVDPANSPAQVQAARTGYRHTTRATGDAAWQAVKGRDVRAAGRHGAKMLWQYGWYVRSEAERTVRHWRDRRAT